MKSHHLIRSALASGFLISITPSFATTTPSDGLCAADDRRTLAGMALASPRISAYRVGGWSQ